MSEQEEFKVSPMRNGNGIAVGKFAGIELAGYFTKPPWVWMHDDGKMTMHNGRGFSRSVEVATPTGCTDGGSRKI